MKVRFLSIAFAMTWLPVQPAIAKPDPMCGPLREFVSSVQPGETRALELHTSWGSNFKDSAEPAISARRCDHYGYAPAAAVCAYLMEHGATEFSGNNLKRAVICLSPKTRMDPELSFGSAVISLTYGGSDVSLEFAEDPKVGGMVLKLAAEGY